MLIQLVYFLAVNKVNVVSDAFIPGKDLYAIHKDTPALLILGLFIIEGHIVVEPEIRMLVWDIVRIQSAFENSFLLYLTVNSVMYSSEFLSSGKCLSILVTCSE